MPPLCKKQHVCETVSPDKMLLSTLIKNESKGDSSEAAMLFVYGTKAKRLERENDKQNKPNPTMKLYV
jgi:hypothetical protein